MKKTFAVLILLAFSASMMAGCSSSAVTSESATEETSTAEVTTTEATTTTTTEATTTTTEVTEATTTETTISRTITVNQSQLASLLKKQPLSITKTKYLVQHKYYKALYPDMLQAILFNRSKEDIKDAVIAFVAWDKNNLPVKIKGNIDYTDGEYIRYVSYSGINLVHGKTYGRRSGFEVDYSCRIKKVKAIVVQYETFDGKTWYNPYMTAWSNMYGGGKKLSNNLSTEVTLTDEDYEEMVKKMKEPSATPAPTKAPKKKSKKKK